MLKSLRLELLIKGLTMKILFRFVLLSLISTTGCVSTQYTTLSKQAYEPVRPENVVVYLAENDIKGNYEKIGLIHMQGESSWTNENQMINAARKKAAKMGANGIILGNVQEPSSGAKVAAAVLGVPTKRRGEVVAIRVSELVTNSKADSIYESIELKEETALPNFRAAVPEAKNSSDEEILSLFRKKYPKLKEKSDDELIQLIEKKYSKKTER